MFFSDKFKTDLWNHSKNSADQWDKILRHVKNNCSEVEISLKDNQTISIYGMIQEIFPINGAEDGIVVMLQVDGSTSFFNFSSILRVHVLK